MLHLLLMLCEASLVAAAAITVPLGLVAFAAIWAVLCRPWRPAPSPAPRRPHPVPCPRRRPFGARMVRWLRRRRRRSRLDFCLERLRANRRARKALVRSSAKRRREDRCRRRATAARIFILRAGDVESNPGPAQNRRCRKRPRGQDAPRSESPGSVAEPSPGSATDQVFYFVFGFLRNVVFRGVLSDGPVIDAVWHPDPPFWDPLPAELHLGNPDNWDYGEEDGTSSFSFGFYGGDVEQQGVETEDPPPLHHLGIITAEARNPRVAFDRLSLLLAGDVEENPGPPVSHGKARPVRLPASASSLALALGEVSAPWESDALHALALECAVGDQIAGYVGRLGEPGPVQPVVFRVLHAATADGQGQTWVSSPDPFVQSAFTDPANPSAVNCAPFPLPGFAFANVRRFRPEVADSSSSDDEAAPKRKKKQSAKKRVAGTSKTSSPISKSDSAQKKIVETATVGVTKPISSAIDREREKVRDAKSRFRALLARFPALESGSTGIPNQDSSFCALNSALQFLRIAGCAFSFPSVADAAVFRNSAAEICGFEPARDACAISALRKLLAIAPLTERRVQSGQAIRTFQSNISFHALNLPLPAVVSDVFVPVMPVMLLSAPGSEDCAGHFVVLAPIHGSTEWSLMDDSSSAVFESVAVFSAKNPSYRVAAVLVPPHPSEVTVQLGSLYGDDGDDGMPAFDPFAETSPPEAAVKKGRRTHLMPQEGCKEARPADVNTIRIVPEHMVNALQLSVAPIFRRLPRAGPAEVDKLIEDFLRFPAIGLPAVSGRSRERNRTVKQALAKARSALQGEDPLPAAEDEKRPGAPQKQQKKSVDEHAPPDEKTDHAVVAATRLARLGYFSRSVRRLLQKPCDTQVDESSAEEQLRKLHPAGDAIDVNAPSAPTFVVTAEMVVEHLRRLTGGKSPGPSGWTEELLLQVAGDNDNAVRLGRWRCRDDRALRPQEAG